MFRKSNLFAVFILSVFTCAAAYGQETVTIPTTPKPVTNVFSFGGLEGGSYLGVQMQEVNKENFSKFGLSEVRGVAIEKVTENSPAAQAGLQNGDVIVRFEGEEVASIRKLQRLLGEVAPDHQAKVTVLRSGKERDFTVTIGKRPGFSFPNGTFTTGTTMTMPTFPKMITPKVIIPKMPTMPPMPNGNVFKIAPNGENWVWGYSSGRSIGIGTSSLTKQLGEHFGVADGKGLLINNVRENSPAAKAGLKAGDVIIEADGKPVSDAMELMKSLNSKEKGSITLTIIRDKNRQTVTVEPEVNKDGNKFQFAPGVMVEPSTEVITTVTPQIAPFTIVTPQIAPFTIVTPQIAPITTTIKPIELN
jgi:serine protease Do